MEVGHLQLLEAEVGLLYITGAEVLLEQEHDLLDEVLDGANPAADAPDVVQPHQPVLHRQQGVGLAERLLGDLVLHVALETRQNSRFPKWLNIASRPCKKVQTKASQSHPVKLNFLASSIVQTCRASPD